jgi:CRP/FNR family transcriptional regulator, nitrogen fixation regulation protein
MSAALSHTTVRLADPVQSLAAVKTERSASAAGHLAFAIPRGPAPSPAEQFDLIGTDVAFPRNSQFYGEGDTSTYLYRIESGVARSYRMTADGRRQIVAFYVSGDVFGFEAGDTHTLSTEAVTDVRVRLFKLGSLLNTASRDDDVAHQLWLCVSRELRRNQEHILQLGKTAPARVASFLLEMVRRMPHADAVALSISRLDIADYLDLRIETVSRILMRLARSGAIALSSNRKITIRNRTLLTQRLD